MKTTLFAFSFLFASGSLMAQNPLMMGLGNPASTNCSAAHGGSLYIMTDSRTGGQYGLCRLDEKTAFEEWCIYRRDLNIETKPCPNLIILLKDEN